MPRARPALTRPPGAQAVDDAVRMFVAVWPDQAVRDALQGLVVDAPAGLRVVPAAQWHVTLRFLGDVDGARRPELLAALAGATTGVVPFAAAVGPATTWLGPEVLTVPVAGLEPIARAVHTATAAVVPPRPDETRPFTGHVTVARARRRLPAPVRASLAGKAVDGELRVDTVVLVGSALGRGVPRYEELGRVRLGGPRRARPVPDPTEGSG